MALRIRVDEFFVTDFSNQDLLSLITIGFTVLPPGAGSAPASSGSNALVTTGGVGVNDRDNVNILYLDNDNLVFLDGLFDNLNQAFLNAATVTSRLLTTAEVEVVASQSLAYVAASDGKYEGTWDKALIAGLSGTHLLEFVATAGAFDFKELKTVEVQDRTS